VDGCEPQQFRDGLVQFGIEREDVSSGLMKHRLGQTAIIEASLQ